MSTVFRATSTVTQTPVILKAYHKEKMRTKNVKRMEREIVLMKQLGGNGIVRLYSVFEDKSTT